jgi:hypothetical protein
MPLPGFEVSAQGTVSQIQDTSMADLAGLPAVWPPDEAAKSGRVVSLNSGVDLPLRRFFTAPVEAFEMDDVGSEQGSLQPRISR